MREEPAGDVEAMLGSSEGGARAPEVAQEGGSRALLPTDPSVLGMDIAYGPDGASVQHADVGMPFMHDRQSTLCASISHRTTAQDGQKRLRTSLKAAHWEQVMRAGLAKYSR